MENFIRILPLHPPPKGETDFPQKTNFYIDFQKLLSKITLRRTYIPPLEEDEGGGHVPHFFDNVTNTRSNSLETGAFNSIFWYVCG